MILMQLFNQNLQREGNGYHMVLFLQKKKKKKKEILTFAWFYWIGLTWGITWLHRLRC